jgi:uncharacterized protein (TIGR01319 family)
VEVVVLTDFGSTFTKVAIVENGTGRLVSRAQSPTTIDSDLVDGHQAALDTALGQLPSRVRVVARLAASSAGGGLRVAAVGLVPDLTAAAARQAALNAGAKVELVLAGQIGDAETRALEGLKPEIILFAGGTNGGQEGLVLSNAEAIASSQAGAHVIVACNRDISAKVSKLFRRSGRTVSIVANVMPRLFDLDIEPTRAAINDAFVGHVIHGKGLSKRDDFARSVLMPTPEAVLRATALLALGPPAAPAYQPVMVVDVGGATTDIHSFVRHVVRPGRSTGALFPVPELLRTVQGDLGVRENALSAYRADTDWLDQQLSGQFAASRVADACRLRVEVPHLVARTSDERAVDSALAASCMAIALARHCGRRTTRVRPGGEVQEVNTEPDLRRITAVIGTGGVIATWPDGSVLRQALARPNERALIPVNAEVLVDRSYILAAAGLYATRDPVGAYALMQAELVRPSND